MNPYEGVGQMDLTTSFPLPCVTIAIVLAISDQLVSYRCQMQVIIWFWTP